MSFEWQGWDGRRVGARTPRSFAPNVAHIRSRRRVPRLGAAVAVIGVTLGTGLAMDRWLARDGDDGGWSSAPIEWNSVQAVPRGVQSAADKAWLARGLDGGGADVDKDDTAGPGVSSGTRARFGLCHSGGGTNCVVDGDTIWLNGENIRIAGIDAPETHDYDCAEERALGDRASARLQQLLNAGAVSLSSIDRDRDRYGRLLRNAAVDGRDVGETLISEGLARPYARGRRPWC